MLSQYYVYFMTNERHNVLYIGVTNSLERRAFEHKQKLVPGFTKKYNCDRLAYYEAHANVRDAIAREKQLKRWTRARKNALVAAMNPNWNDLAADWFADDGKGSLAVFAAQDDGEQENLR